MNILGVSGAVGHDPSAALFVDGQLVAAVEEERFLRDKHAKGKFPLQSSRYRRNVRGVVEMLDQLGVRDGRSKFRPVEHHLAHASSACHLCGFSGKTAILGIDGKGKYATTFFGYGENGRIHPVACTVRSPSTLALTCWMASSR